MKATKPLDPITHLLRPRKGKLPPGTPRSHGICGVNIGRFTPRIEEVNCTACIAEHKKTKEN